MGRVPLEISSLLEGTTVVTTLHDHEVVVDITSLGFLSKMTAEDAQKILVKRSKLVVPDNEIIKPGQIISK